MVSHVHSGCEKTPFPNNFNNKYLDRILKLLLSFQCRIHSLCLICTEKVSKRSFVGFCQPFLMTSLLGEKVFDVVKDLSTTTGLGFWKD